MLLATCWSDWLICCWLDWIVHCLTMSEEQQPFPQWFSRMFDLTQLFLLAVCLFNALLATVAQNLVDYTNLSTESSWQCISWHVLFALSVPLSFFRNTWLQKYMLLCQFFWWTHCKQQTHFEKKMSICNCTIQMPFLQVNSRDPFYLRSNPPWLQFADCSSQNETWMRMPKWGTRIVAQHLTSASGDLLSLASSSVNPSVSSVKTSLG